MEISIVIPICNPKQEYLEPLFYSIEKQTFQDFEIIISDDENSEKLIYNCLPISLIDKVQYAKNPGKKGIFSNLNNGLRLAKGNKIQLFCQDDIMMPDLLYANYSKLSDKTELVFSQFDAISSTHKIISIHREEVKYIPSIIPSIDANNYFLYFGCIPGNLSPVMLSKNLLEIVGYFNEDYQYVGDFEFWIRAAKFTNLFFNKEKHLLVRRHNESASSQLGTLQRFLELKKLLPYLIVNNSIPLSKRILRRYIHIHVFRSVFLHNVLNAVKLHRIKLSQLLRVFDRNPFSLRLAFLSFLFPIPKVCKPLKKMMEINRV